ncbi:carbonic anhydrase [Chelatococcus sp. SYSU_G07232]|uniref:carbonic anhydrase n=1 Tax=Chelatococcus albus TaxID=3047466 RepID=A0ABT7ABF1_9HYPH|nr:carbonic anhydrase [Chelatococcus sp. SYSU_G07232]MDJ1156653.1 carbonic anhydrase [Chelatococcus sp. SYSU_G07232]
MCDNHPLPLSRRGFLAAGAATAFLGGLALPASAQEAAPAAPNAISPDEALKILMDGNARYAANTARNKDFSAGRAARAGAQYPIAGLVSCADSRVAPELTFDQGPGELFVVRLAGNFVNEDGLASLEYGVKFLGMPLIMVLGHSNCGAVAATIKVLKDKTQLPGHLPLLANAIRPAVEIAQKVKAENPLEEAIAENVRYNVRRLQEAKPIVAEFVRSGRVKVVGGVYDLATGKVSLL